MEDLRMEKIRIGVIGGTGVYDIEGLSDVKELVIDTPFGKPSDKILIGKYEGKYIAFLPRHGKGHKLLPTELPQKANVWALKSLGVEYVISFTAVGSLKEELVPKHFVLPNQIIDKTFKRDNTFFGNGLVVHTAFAEPYCEELRNIILKASKNVECTLHNNGIYVCMEGPLFSTRAESNLHRSWGASVIGMTAIPEAKLVREAEMCYASVCMVTDYDCWREEEEAVTSDAVIATLKENSATAKMLLKEVLNNFPETERTCECSKALACSIMTPRQNVPEETYKKVKLLVEKYL
jgi:5'-methylthioadenosine phosphorylase